MKYRRPTLLIAMTLALAACSHRELNVGGLPSNCRILLRGFCISASTAGYRLMIREESASTDGFTYVVTGTDGSRPWRNFTAAIRNSDAGELPVTSHDDRCSVYDVAIDHCANASLMRVVYTYTVAFGEMPDNKVPHGIKIDLLQATDVAPEIARTVAYPCQVMSNGGARCAADLGVCRQRTTALGCS